VCFVLITLVGGRVRFSDDLDARASDLLGAVIADTGDREIADAAKRIRNELDLRWTTKPGRSLVVGFAATSAGAGATSLVSALGRHYAGAGLNVLLIDANPTAHGIGRHANTGQAPAVRDAASLADAVRNATIDKGSLELLVARSEMPRQQSEPFGPELSFEEMRRMLQVARDEHDVVLVDLGVLQAGGQAAVGCALSDRVIVVAACGEGKQRISKTLDLLDRLAPARLLLALNRMPAIDPQRASASAGANSETARYAWLKNPFNT
jgi:Mrp family chromosome partitioning ATPase